MPLFINGTKVKHELNIDRFVQAYPQFKEKSQTLLSQEAKEVGPKDLLYICQRELAGTSTTDGVISVLGSEDATTCHIAVLRHTGSGATSMCHFDGSSIPEGLQTMVSIVKKNTADVESGRFEIHLVGGFLDERGNSHDVSNSVLSAICESPEDLHLETACVTHFNTTFKDDVPFPVIYGVACNVKTGEIFRAKFPDKGPDLALRSARHFTGGDENIVIYDSETKHLTIGPFNYSNHIDVDGILSLPNQYIRKFLSTSPEQEPEGFEDHIRESLVQIKNFPDPLTSVFKGKPRNFEKDKTSGLWSLIQ